MHQSTRKFYLMLLMLCAGWQLNGSAYAVDLSGIASIATGADHSCAVTTSGGVKCWGNNSFYQLGDGTSTQPTIAVDAVGLASGVSQVAAGRSFTCVLTTSGGVKCWGILETFGGSPVVASTPTDILGLTSGVSAFTANGAHACALTTAGGVKCWGWNDDGQLGDNSTTSRYYSAADVVGLTSGVAAIAAGEYHTCALTTGGGVKCWGRNSAGALGDNTYTRRLTPVDVSGLASGVIAIASGGSHTCAVMTGGGAKCWGDNLKGQIGDNSSTIRTVPTDVTGLASGVASIAAGRAHTCAMTALGGAKCWGDNAYGQLGDTSISDRLTPVDVFGLANGVAAITASVRHTCVLTSAETIKCWGDKSTSLLGDGSTTYRQTPVNVSGLAGGTAKIAAGDDHTCALAAGGVAKCWGKNVNGQVGDNSVTSRIAPTDVTGLASGVGSIAAGGNHSCAITALGGVKCWGFNYFGQLGDSSSTERHVPTDVTGLGAGVAAIATGWAHTCAALSAGGVKCWGINEAGTLGNNSIVSSLTPVDVSGLSGGVTAITTGLAHTCALTVAGAVKCWGDNGSHQLGDNSTTDQLVPTDVTGLSSGIIAIASGAYFTCAVNTAGGVKCWGSNNAFNSAVPVDMPGLASGIVNITAGRFHACVLTTTGGVKCWGTNTYGQLGDDSRINRSTPVDVVGLTSGVVAIAAGTQHTCAITVSGVAKCWGNNSGGAVGDGTPNKETAPVSVITPAPDAPISVTASGGNTTASVGFTLPVSYGRAPVTGYTVTSNPAGGIDSNANTTSLTHLITGLTNGVSYTFTVTATNAAGISNPSAASNIVTPAGPPGVPTNVVISAGSLRVTATFNAPVNNGGAAITSYTLSCSAPGQTTRSASGATSPLIIFGLVAGVSYSCTVTASNSAGSSAASASVLVTPKRSSLTPLLMLLLD